MKKAILIGVLAMSCNWGMMDDPPDRKVKFMADSVDFEICGVEGVTITIDGVSHGSIAKQFGFAKMVTLETWITQQSHTYLAYSVGRGRVWTGEIPAGSHELEIHICCGRSCEL